MNGCRLLSSDDYAGKLSVLISQDQYADRLACCTQSPACQDQLKSGKSTKGVTVVGKDSH